MNDSVTAESNGLSIAALVFGILAILGSVTVVATPFFAMLAITFAWLSRGEKKMCVQARVGNILAWISILLSFIVLLIMVILFSGFLMNIFYGVHSGLQGAGGILL